MLSWLISGVVRNPANLSILLLKHYLQSICKKQNKKTCKQTNKCIGTKEA